jgi:CheY-like chemotaxis protein
MITPILPAKLSPPQMPSADKKRRVLLVDGCCRKREMRAEVMRKMGIEVDSAADIAEARCWWKAALYDLVLLNVEDNRGSRGKFCEDLRSAAPHQRFAFLVGKPDYLSDSPGTDIAFGEHGEDTGAADLTAALSINLADLPRRWGFVEASRRISAVRSASNARTQAMRNRPSPSRDLETSQGRYAPVASRTLDDLLREDMQ